MSKRRADFQLDRDGRHIIEEELDRKAQEDKFFKSTIICQYCRQKIGKLRKPLNKPEEPFNHNLL